MPRNFLLLSVLLRPRRWRVPAYAVSVAVLAASVAPPAAASETVTQQFQRANRLFKEGQSRAAAGVLLRIVARYPDHQPSHLLLGRIAFRGGKIKRAVHHFKRVPLDLVGADTAYEYGVSMFVGTEFGIAAKALGKVPFGAKEYELASFYRGLSYMRLSQYQRAMNLLNRAETLPANLESSKREALEILQAKLRSEQRGGPQQQAPYLIAPTPPPPPVYDPYAGAPPPPASDKGAGAKKSAKPPPASPPPKTGLSTTLLPALTISQSASQSDMHGFEMKDSEERKTTLALSTNLRYDAEQRPGGGQPYASLKLDLNQVTSSIKGTSVKYVAYESDPTSIREQQTQTPTTSSKEANAVLRPEVGYPISGSIDLKAAYNYANKYLNLRADQQVTVRGPEGRIGVGVAGLNMAGTGLQNETLDAKGATQAVETVVKGEASKSLETLTLTASGSQSQTDAPLPVKPNPKEKQVLEAGVTKTWDSFSMTATGNSTTWGFVPGAIPSVAPVPTTQLRMQLSGTKTFEFGGSVTGTFAQTKQEGIYWLFDDKTQPADADGKFAQKPVKADNTVQDAIAKLSLTPLDWLTLSTSFAYTQNAYVIADPTMEVAWLQFFPEIVTTFNVSVTISKAF